MPAVARPVQPIASLLSSSPWLSLRRRRRRNKGANIVVAPGVLVGPDGGGPAALSLRDTPHTGGSCAAGRLRRASLASAVVGTRRGGGGGLGRRVFHGTDTQDGAQPGWIEQRADGEHARPGSGLDARGVR